MSAVAEKQSGADGDDNTGVIAGAVVGGLAIAAIAGVVIVMWSVLVGNGVMRER